MGDGNNQAALSRTDVIVVALVLSLLVSILIPSILQARDSARDQECRNTLRSVGKELFEFSQNDPESRLCSGAFSFPTDGSPDKFGWIADLRSRGYTDSLLCPGSDHKGSVALNGFLTEKPSAKYGITDDRLGVGRFWKEWVDAKDEQDRFNSVRRAVGGDWNTNYCSSWFLIRTGLPWSRNGDILQTRNCDQLRSSLGPLKLHVLESSHISMASIPLLSEGSTGGQLRQNLGNQLPEGAALAHTFSRGPAFVDADGKVRVVADVDVTLINLDTYQPQVFPGKSTVVTTENEMEFAHPHTTGLAKRKALFQDTTVWAPAHDNSSNVLMSDGSVKQLEDINRDGFFNPGFPASKRNEFQDGTCEISPANIYLGIEIRWFKPRAVF